MNDQDAVTIANLLARLENGWNDLHTYLKTLNETQMTIPTNAAGGTVKDHLMHLAVWEDGIHAVLTGDNRRERMGVDSETWKSDGFEQINAHIQQQHKDKPLSEVMTTFADIHQRMIDKIQTLSDADLMLPYNYYQPRSTQTAPMIGHIAGNTFGHYEEHLPWMQAIVAGS